MSHTNITTTADALALPIAEITAFTLGVEIEATEPSIDGASFAEAMATVGTLDLPTLEWTDMIDGFHREGAEFELA